MKIIENDIDWKEFITEFEENDSIVIPIQCDDNKHPCDTKLSLLYVSIKDKEFILPFNHSESLNLPEEYLNKIKSSNKKYTYDKKKLLHFVNWENVIDLNLNYYMNKNEPLYIEDITTAAHRFFYSKFYNQDNINTIIPIMKHLESCHKLTKLFKEKNEVLSDCVNLSYNNKVLENLQYIESNGLQTLNGKVYSEYNPYTSTGRPSNRFGGINFAALNKKDGSRKPFVSRFEDGVLVEMDYDGYHLRLIADKVGYEFPEGSVYEYMAKFYSCSYKESKQKSFQYLYGGIPMDVVQLNPFFSKVYDFIEHFWKVYKEKDFINSNIYNKKIYKKNLSDMNKNKLFNYFIQLMETENNMKMLTSLIPQLDGYESKLILYSYDSFLFDFNIDDGLDYLKKVKSVIEQNGKYPVKVGWGNSYHDMKDITEKFVD